MKKQGILVLLVLLFIVAVIGYTAKSQPQDEASQATGSNQAEQSAPIESDEPAEPSGKVGEAQPMAARTNLTQEELIRYFEAAYNAGQVYADLGYDEDSLIEQELKELSYFVEDGTAKWPDDVNDQYLAWREANHPKKPATETPASNPQTKPVQQAGGNVDTGSTDAYYNSHQGGDPTQSSIFEIPDDPWEGSAHIKNYGGTGSSEGPKHDDPTQSSIFEIPDDPWAGQPQLDYGGD